MITAIIGFVFTVSFLVFVHEYGHYSIAKFYGVKIEEFSIGFGRELISIVDKSGVRWKICLIPLGGFVKMYKDERGGDSALRAPGEFYSKPAYQRLLIIVGGPFANFLLAFIILAGFYCYYGNRIIPPIIDEVTVNSPAEKAGIIKGDKIIAIREKYISDFLEFKQNLILNPNLPLALTIERGDQIFDVNITSYINPESPSPMIGIKSTIGYYVPLNILDSAQLAFSDIYNTSRLTIIMLKQMLFGQRSSDAMHGPITIAKESATSLDKGFANFLIFLAMISINLGVVNILPIPILDGGHLLFTFYEMIIKKPLSKNLQNLFSKIGLAIIIFLIIISTTNDIRDLLI
jgi:regulator of sigma E protease